MDEGRSFSQLADTQALLRNPALRRRCFECAAAGKKYSADLLEVARKSAVIAAVNVASDRLKRRSAASVRPSDLQTRLAIFKCQKRRRLKAAHSEDVTTFTDTIRGVFRTATAGSHSLEVEIEPLVANIGATGVSSRGDYYSRNCTYRRIDSRHTYRIPPHWKDTVANRGLGVLDGLITLWAELESDQDGIATYAAVWVRQGRGFSLETSRGWIALHNGTSFHCTRSAEAARRGACGASCRGRRLLLT